MPGLIGIRLSHHVIQLGMLEMRILFKTAGELLRLLYNRPKIIPPPSFLLLISLIPLTLDRIRLRLTQEA